MSCRQWYYLMVLAANFIVPRALLFEKSCWPEFRLRRYLEFRILVFAVLIVRFCTTYTLTL